MQQIDSTAVVVYLGRIREKAQGYEKRRHFQNMNGEYTRMFKVTNGISSEIMFSISNFTLLHHTMLISVHFSPFLPSIVLLNNR